MDAKFRRREEQPSGGSGQVLRGRATRAVAAVDPAAAGLPRAVRRQRHTQPTQPCEWRKYCVHLYIMCCRSYQFHLKNTLLCDV